MENNKFLIKFIKSTLKNGIPISLTRMTTSTSLFILAIIVARKLGPAEFGKFSVCFSLYAIFELISNLGLDNLLIREIAKDETKSSLFFSNGIILGVFSTSFCFFLLILTGNLMFYPWEIKKNIYLIGILLLPSFINFLSETIFIALQKARFVFYGSLIREFFMLTLSILFLSVGAGIFYIIIAIFLSRLIGLCLYMYFFLRAKLKLVPQINKLFLKNIARMIPVFILISIMASIFLEIDTLILSKVVAISDVGIYSMAKKFMRASFIFIFGIITAIFPVISQSFSLSKEEFMRMYKLFFKYIFLLSLLITVIVLIFSPLIIRLFLGRKFIDAIPVMKILFWSIIPWGLSFLFSRFLIAGGQQNKDLLALFTGLLSITICGIFLSFKWANTGMAFANLISMIILAGMHYFFVKKYVINPLNRI